MSLPSVVGLPICAAHYSCPWNPSQRGGKRHVATFHGHLFWGSLIHYIKLDLATLWHLVCSCRYMTLTDACGSLHLNLHAKALLDEIHVVVWKAMEWYGSTRLDMNKTPLVVVCKFCGYHFSFWRNCCLTHLGWIRKGTKQPQIKKCTKVLPTTKTLFCMCGHISPRTNVKDEVHITPPMHQYYHISRPRVMRTHARILP